MKITWLLKLFNYKAYKIVLCGIIKIIINRKDDIFMINFRTDLALERRELFRKANNIANEVDGIETKDRYFDRLIISDKLF